MLKILKNNNKTKIAKILENKMEIAKIMENKTKFLNFSDVRLLI